MCVRGGAGAGPAARGPAPAGACVRRAQGLRHGEQADGDGAGAVSPASRFAVSEIGAHWVRRGWRGARAGRLAIVRWEVRLAAAPGLQPAAGAEGRWVCGVSRTSRFAVRGIVAHGVRNGRWRARAGCAGPRDGQRVPATGQGCQRGEQAEGRRSAGVSRTSRLAVCEITAHGVRGCGCGGPLRLPWPTVAPRPVSVVREYPAKR
jgi:hypothetical protein